MTRNEKESEHFRKLLERKNLKFTRERQLLLEEVLRMKNHFDADELYEIFKAKGLRISRDTVYRTLPLFLECGVLQKSVGDSRREYFERMGAKGHHDHMICLSCGKIIEFSSTALEAAQERVCKKFGFEMAFHDHRLFGSCQACAKKAASNAIQ